MSELDPIFSEHEFRARVSCLQATMVAQGLDALLLTTAADIFYVTGFLTRFWESPARPWFLIVPTLGDPVAVIPSIGADVMNRTWLGTCRTWDAPVPEDDGVTLLAETLCDLCQEAAKIGVPMGLETHLRMPLANYAQVQQLIHPRVFVDGTDAVQRVREIKSDAEVEKIRASCAIADRAFARVPEIAPIGRPLSDVFRAFQMLLLEEGADWVSYLAGAAGQGGYGDVISPATPAPLRVGDVLMVDTGAVRDGYFCDFNRNYAIGPVSDQVARTQSALWDVSGEVLELLRPGMLALDVHREIWSRLERVGVEPCKGRLGHGLGLTLTEWPSFTPLDKTELREGMVLTLEPSAFVSSGRILVHEENFVLRSTGPELLSTRAPLQMMEIGG